MRQCLIQSGRLTSELKIVFTECFGEMTEIDTTSVLQSPSQIG